MKPKKKDVWEKITDDLRSRVSLIEFKTWISKAYLEKLNDNITVIHVPNKFFAEWIRDNYLQELKNLFQKYLDHTPIIQFSFHPSTHLEKDTSISRTVRSDIHNKLNASMTFQHFVIGECNRFAVSSAIEVASNPSNHYNPLYIFGGPGSGKTHILHAIGHHSQTIHPHLRIDIVSSDSFSSGPLSSVKDGNDHPLRDRYRIIDLLLFDDVQGLSGRNRSQQEFLFLFNALYNARKQIVITGNRPPNELRSFSTQLKSRLGSGILSEIKEPDHETKIALIKNQSKENNIHISDDGIFFLAKSNQNIRILLEDIERLKDYSSSRKGEIDASLIKSLLPHHLKRQITVEDIKSHTAGYFHISISEMISEKKHRHCSYPRHIAMYLCKKYTKLSYKEIGQSFGSRDHASVIYGVHRIERQKSQNKNILEDLNKMEKLLL